MPTTLTIAVLEDHDTLRELTVAALQKYGHRVFGAYDSAELGDLFALHDIDLLVLDLNLPGEDGLSVSRRLKAVSPKLFIIMTTARGGIDDRVSGYESGADIYLPKPVSEHELLAAVAAHARRLETNVDAARLTLNSRERLLRGTNIVRLSDMELVLLKTMAQSPDGRTETWQLLQVTGREVNDKSKASLEVQIAILRKKLSEAGYSGPAIRAVRSLGYQLICPIRLG